MIATPQLGLFEPEPTVSDVVAHTISTPNPERWADSKARVAEIVKRRRELSKAAEVMPARSPEAQELVEASFQKSQAAARQAWGSKPKVCEICGRTKAADRVTIHLHHWSYEPEDWTDVIPLCGSCHQQVHRGEVIEPRTGRFYARRA